MNRHSMRSRLLVGAALPLMVVAAQAQAQQTTPAAPAEEGAFTEIVVTAQKRAQNLQDVPIAVTALGGDQLATANVQGQIDLPKLTPNLNFTVNSSFASAYIRGVGTQFGNPGLESSVSVYLDDMYIPRASAGLFGFGDIARIEVLKGPQGTLYGRNATGGAIRVITNDPKDVFEAKVAATVGSYETRTIDGMINLPINQNLALRFAARHDENKGYVRNLAPAGGVMHERNFQRRNEEVYTGKLLWESGDLKVKLSADYSEKDDNESVSEANLFPGGPEQIGMALGGCGSTGFYTLCNDGYGYVNPIAYGGSLRIDYDIGAATLSSISAYRKEYEVNCADIDGTGAPLQPVCGKPYTKQWTQEFQITSNPGGPLNYVAGVYYLRERSGYPFTVILADQTRDPTFQNPDAIYSAPLVALQSSGEGVRVSSIAPYAQIDYDLSDKFSLSAGLRYTQETKRLRGNVAYITMVDPATGQPVGGPIDPATGTSLGSVSDYAALLPECTPASPAATCSSSPRDSTFNKLTYKLTASYKPVEDVLLYATISRGFKSGGLNLPAFAYVDAVQPETLDDYEIGWKIEQGHIRWNGAAFYYDYSDLQIAITDQSTGGTRIKNAASATIKGIESDFTWAPSRQFELGVGGAYLTSKYKNFIGDAYYACSDIPGLSTNTPAEAAGVASGLAQCTSQGGLGLGLVSGRDLSGNRLVNAPKFSGYVRAQVNHEFDGIGKFTLGGVANYRSKAYFDSANLFDDPSRLMLSAKVTWTSENEHYFASISGENLTKKKYLTIKSPQNLGGWRGPGQPRWFYFTAGVKF